MFFDVLRGVFYCFTDVPRMRCKRYQCFTMCFSMFHKFVISEGPDGNVLQIFLDVSRSVSYVLRMCHELCHALCQRLWSVFVCSTGVGFVGGPRGAGSELRAWGGGATSRWAQSSGLRVPSRFSLSEPVTHEHFRKTFVKPW